MAAPEVTIWTSNMRTVEPPTRDAGASAAVYDMVHGAVVLKPSSALSATAGSPKLAGLAYVVTTSPVLMP